MATVARLEIRVSADTSAAVRRLTALNALVGRVGDTSNRTNRNLLDLDRSMRRLSGTGNGLVRTINNNNNGMRRTTRSGNSLQNAMASITGQGKHLDITLELIYLAIVALAPVIYTAVGAAGALASMLTVAATGLGVFGGAVYATRKQMDKILIQPLIKDFDAWGKSLESTMKPVYVAWVTALTGKLKNFNPIVDTMAAYMTKAGKAMGSFLGGNQFKSWLDDVNKSLKIVMPNLGSFIGDLLVGFLELMRAFIPQANKMSASLADMGKRFRTWAEGLDNNKAFQDFIKDFEEMGPKVWKVVKELSAAIWDLIVGLAPLGVEILKLAGAFGRMISEADPETIKKIALAFLGLMIVSRITALVNGLVLAFSGLGMAMNPITAVIMLVIGLFAWAWSHSQKLRDNVEELKQAFARLWEALKPAHPIFKKLFEGLRAVVSFVAEQAVSELTKFINGLAAFLEWLDPAVRTAWQNIQSGTKSFMGWMSGNFNTFKDTVTGIWNAVWDYIAPKVEAVWAYVTNAVSIGWKAVTDAFNAGKDYVMMIWNTVWEGMKMVVGAVWMVIAGIIGAAWTVISGIFEVASFIIIQIWRILWEIIYTIVVIAWELVKAIVEVFWWVISNTFKVGAGIVIGFWNALWEQISFIVKAAWKVIGPYIMGAVNAVASGLSKAWNGIKTVASAVWSTIRSGLEAVWNVIKTTATATWEAISGTISSVWNAIWGTISSAVEKVKSFLTRTWDSINSAVSTGWNKVKDTITKVVDAIVDGIRAFREDAVGTIRKAKDKLIEVFDGAIDWLFNAGKDVIRGLINGIKDMAKGAADAAKGVVKGAINGAKSLLGISSPSKVFFEIGAWTTEGFARGITDEIPMASHSVDRMVNHTIGAIPPPSVGSRTTGPEAATASAQSGGDTYHFHFEGAIITGGEKQIENMVVDAIKEASRKGRLRNVTGSSI